MEGVRTSWQGGGSRSAVDLIDRLTRFDGPPDEFLSNLLAVQCQVAGAAGGVIIRVNPRGQAEAVAVYPPLAQGATPPVWLAQSAESASQVLSSGVTVVKPLRMQDDLYGAPARRHLVLVPLRSGGSVRGVAAFLLETGDPQLLEAGKDRVELTIGLLSIYEMRLTLQRRQADLNRMRQAMETLAAVNEHDRFRASAMAICNEVSAGWNCDRVSLGFHKGRYVHLRALSHAEKFSRKMKLVQDIEAAMEECLDQDLEIIHPSGTEATYISRATAQLSSRHGPTAIISLPLRKAGKPVAVLTAERSAELPFQADEIETLRATCDLGTPRLANLYEQDRWFGARAAAATRKGLASVVGPKHTWIKLAAVLVFAALVFLIFVKGEYRAQATCAVQAQQRRFVPAPFDGYLESVSVVPGQAVVAGQELATLRTDMIEAQLRTVRNDWQSNKTKADVAMAQGEKGEAYAAIARLEMAAASAKIELLELRLKQARITAPIDGVVNGQDLDEHLEAPVKSGERLFEISQEDAMRAELLVSEEDIADLTVAETEIVKGELAVKSRPSDRIPFEVVRINPVAEVVEQRNVYKVRVRLLERPDWIMPGMEGIAKIDLGRKPYGVLITRRMVNWAVMKFWL